MNYFFACLFYNVLYFPLAFAFLVSKNVLDTFIDGNKYGTCTANLMSIFLRFNTIIVFYSMEIYILFKIKIYIFFRYFVKIYLTS